MIAKLCVCNLTFCDPYGGEFWGAFDTACFNGNVMLLRLSPTWMGWVQFREAFQTAAEALPKISFGE